MEPHRIIRNGLTDHEWTAIGPFPPNKPRAFHVNDRRVLNDRVRNLVERFVDKIERCWRVATRYNKLAANYIAFIQLAAIRIRLRTKESSS